MGVIVVNRHREILATDGEFYPAEAFPPRTPRLFDRPEDAEACRLTITWDYTRVEP